MAEVLMKSVCSGCLGFPSSPKNPSVSSLAAFSSVNVQPLKYSSNSNFHGRKIIRQPFNTGELQGQNLPSSPIQRSISIGKAWQWWEKGLQPNMKDITSARDLVESLLRAGDKLVILDFFSPGCGGCRALHPKICQFAEMNPDILFLQVNHEEHKSMCYSLNVHVLPFFRFYRGAHGRLCSFSCTNATIQKFKDALAKHGTDRSSLGPPRGLEESELLALAANKDLCFDYTPRTHHMPGTVVQEDRITSVPAHLNPLIPSDLRAAMDSQNKTLVTAGS